MGFSRQEYWSGLPCPPPGDLLYPGIESASLTSPALAGGFFTTSATWEAPLQSNPKRNHQALFFFLSQAEEMPSFQLRLRGPDDRADRQQALTEDGPQWQWPGAAGHAAALPGAPAPQVQAAGGAVSVPPRERVLQLCDLLGQAGCVPGLEASPQMPTPRPLPHITAALRPVNWDATPPQTLCTLCKCAESLQSCLTLFHPGL